MVGGKFYMREAASTQQLNRDEIREFFFEEGLIRFDEQVCRQFSLKKDFDNRKYAAFLRASRIPKGMKKEDVLRNLHLLAEDGVRNAGVLLFAKDPAKFFLQAVVVCAVFQGKGKAKIIDKRTVGGTIVECYTGTMAYLREHLNTEYVIRGGPREEVLELPEDALREAILNALAHRDYRLTGAIQVHVFFDRVEILNPGSLVSGLKIEDLGHVSRPRNPLLFGLMDRMELVENVGSGIKRIRDALQEYGLRPPLIRTAETWFSITFRRKKSDEAIESLSRKGIGEPARRGSPKGSPITRERILAAMSRNPRITIAGVAAELGISGTAVKKHIHALKESGKIQRMGSDREGLWKVIK
jgi:ATP-dependent DNA helicase RecG